MNVLVELVLQGGVHEGVDQAVKNGLRAGREVG